MEAYAYSNPVKLLYGAGQVDRVAEEILPYGKKVLLVYGQHHLKDTGVYDRIVAQFHRKGLAWCDLGGVRANPKLDLVQEGIDVCRQEKIDFILGVGGGSVSDTAKAISMGVRLDCDVWQLYEDFHRMMHGATGDDLHVPTDVLPIGVVMTKAATGSEFDYTSVLSNRATQEKLMVINKVMYPKFAVHDPTLTYSVSAEETAYGTADIMTHYLEQYLTRSTDTEVLDRYKEAGLKTVIDNGPRVLRNRADAAAQSNLLYCAAWACSDQNMCGTLGGWAAHMLEHEVSAITDINHGHGMAIIYLPWMRSIVEEIPEKFAQYGERVWGIDRRGQSDLDVGREAIERTGAFWSSLGISLTWGEAGVDRSVLPVAAQCAVRFGPLFSVRQIQQNDALQILQAA